MHCRYLQRWETHDVGHACGASPPRRAYRMNAAAGGAECFCCSSSYVSSGCLIKNIARYHSCFMGHLQNELSAAHRALSGRLHTRVSMSTSTCCRFLFKKNQKTKNTVTGEYFTLPLFFLFWVPFEHLPGSHDCHITSLVAGESWCACVCACVCVSARSC